MYIVLYKCVSARVTISSMLQGTILLLSLGIYSVISINPFTMN